MAWLAQEIHKSVGITVSVGLSYNKSLAKLASDLDKPNGFAVIGQKEAMDFLAPRPVRDIWGVGQALGRTLSKDGIVTIGQLQHREKNDLMARYGVMGAGSIIFHAGKMTGRFPLSVKAKAYPPKQPSTTIYRIAIFCLTGYGRYATRSHGD